MMIEFKVMKSSNIMAPLLAMMLNLHQLYAFTAEKTLIAEVYGIVCAFCVKGVEKRFEKLGKTDAVFISLEHKRVLVAEKAGVTISESEFTDAIKEAGFKLVRIERSTRPFAAVKNELAADNAGKSSSNPNVPAASPIHDPDDGAMISGDPAKDAHIPFSKTPSPPPAVAVPTPPSRAVTIGSHRAHSNAAEPQFEIPSLAASFSGLLIDDFGLEVEKNALGLISGVFQRSPSSIMASIIRVENRGQNSHALKLDYDKKNHLRGATGGWCGYYTHLRDIKTAKYFDGNPYEYLTFWVKGDRGGENFILQISDKNRNQSGEPANFAPVTTYISSGRLTTHWQRATVPLKSVNLDWGNLESLMINFDSSCFPNGESAGTIYLMYLAFE